MDGNKIQLNKFITKKKKKESPILSFIITGVLILTLIILSYILINYYILGGRITKYVKNKKLISVLFLGLDDAENYKKTDTIFIGLYNPTSQKFGLIAIPRDMKVSVEDKMGMKTVKINSVYSHYGIKKLFKVINNLTGIKLKFYVSLNIEGLIKIVDLLDGVDLYVEKPMKYIDRADNLFIELPKGIIKSDGLKAMEFIRFRNDERGDIGRIDRQYEFILNLAKKMVVKKNLLTNLKFIKIILKNLKTNLTFNDILKLIKHTSSADFNNISMVKLPGKPINLYGIEYIEPDIQKTREITKNFIKKLYFAKTDYVPQEIKVQVLNGSGKRGIAKRIRDKLVRNGFNVIEFGNAKSQDYEQTIILDRTGNMKKALKVQVF